MIYIDKGLILVMIILHLILKILDLPQSNSSTHEKDLEKSSSSSP